MYKYFDNLIIITEGGNHLPAPPITCPRPVKDLILVASPDTQNDHYSVYFYLGDVKDNFHTYTSTHIHSFKLLPCSYNYIMIIS